MCGDDSPSLNEGNRRSALPRCPAPEQLLLLHAFFVSPFESCHFDRVSPWVQLCAVFSDQVSPLEGKLSKGTVDGAGAEDVHGEMRGPEPQRLSGEKWSRAGRLLERLLVVGLHCH